MPRIVITGASSGIGAAVARLAASQHWSMLVHARASRSALSDAYPDAGWYDDARSDVRHSPVAAVCADLSVPAGIDQLKRAVQAWSGDTPPDAWVHLAGADVLTKDRSADFLDKLDLLWRVDVRATIELCRWIGTWMADAAGHSHTKPAIVPSIVTVGWDQATAGIEVDSGQYFGPTKAAVMAFTMSLAKQLAPHVRVNCVAPGWIQTEWGEQHASPEWATRARGEACLARWGRPADVAAAAMWLCSPQAEFVNSQVLAVNGGWRPAYASERPL